MANLYWVGNSGNFNDAAHWASSSGGAGGAGVPTPTDDVFFDSNSFTITGRIVTIVGSTLNECRDMNWTGALHSPTMSFPSPSSGSNLNIYGAMTLTANMSVTTGGDGNEIDFWSAAFLQPITTAGVHLPVNLFFRGFGGWVLQDAMTLFHNSGISVSHGVLDTNDQAVRIDNNFNVNSGALDLGASIVTIALSGIQTGGFFMFGGIVSEGTSKLVFLNTGTGYWTLENDIGNNLYNLDAHGIGFLDFSDFTFHTFTVYPGANISFPDGQTITANSLIANGTAGNHIVFQSQDLGMQYTISATVVSVSYIDVTDSIAAGSIPFNDAGGIDGGNNINWSIAPYTLPDILSVGDLTFDFGQLQGNIFFDSLNFDQLGIAFSDINTLPTIGDDFALINPPDPVVIRFGIIGPYYVNLTGLIDGQTYYVRTFGQIGGVYYYGPVISFVTPARAAITLPGANSPLSNYQFLLYDPAGNLVADLSGYIDAREFTLTRNRPEEITFTINFYTLNKLASDLHLNAYDMIKPGIQEIRVVRKGTVICAGQIVYWDASLGGEQQITVKALGWMNLFSYRVFSGEYDGDDANFIIRDLITQTQALTNGNFGVTLGASATGTNVYTQKIFENKVISDILIEMSEEENGFDFQFSWDKIFTVYHPSQGSDRPEILFTSPGNMKEVTISNDATQIVNSLLARGKGNADANINTIITDAPSQVTYKLRTAVKDYPDMDADQLIQEASAEVAYYRNPVVLHTITYDAGNKACPEIGNYNVGDRVRIFVTGLPILQDFNQYFKIDKIHVTLGKDGSETVELSVNNIITL